MATVLATRPKTNSTGTSSGTNTLHRRPSSSAGHRSTSTSLSTRAGSVSHTHTHSSASNPSSLHSRQSSLHIAPRNVSAAPLPESSQPQRHIRSQYPASSSEKHVEYILVASFDIDRGSVMEHQYPGPVGGDEHMLAELMLPDQTHLRSQDWTIFFLHKDADEEEQAKKKKRRRRRKKEVGEQAGGGAEEDGGDEAEGEDGEPLAGEEGWSDEEDDLDGIDGPPLVYVLNLVNTKQDNTVKRGAVVKAMAICTRHSFLHIYKPLLLLALEQYFANPIVATLESLYNAVNSMDLSLMPRLSMFERFILQSSEAKDLFIEKFDAIIAQRMAGKKNEAVASATSPTHQNHARNRYGLPRDTHEFESVVHYANIPVPVKIPTALSPENVGDFSLIKLITTFSTPHTTAPQPFAPTHPHLTTSGPTTHPVIVLLNALLTQKRIIFLGHNLPSSEVAEAVLGACALASGGMLRGFTRHAFPYTDLTKIDDLLRVPGFIAGVTNPAFALKSEWWDLLCDLSTGRMKISPNIERAPLSEGVMFFQQPGNHVVSGMGPGSGGISAIAAAGASLSAGLAGGTIPTSAMGGDATGDGAFMANVLKAIEERHGENAIRSKFRRWILKFTRLAATFEETVYGASNLHIHASPKTPSTPFAGSGDFPSPSLESPGFSKAQEQDLPAEITGHGYIWPSPQLKNAELAANATRIEAWRTTRSYYNFIQDLALYYVHRPVKTVDLQNLHDQLVKLRLNTEQSANIYLAICEVAQEENEINQLLAVVVNGAGDLTDRGGKVGQGLFYLGLGLLHPRVEVREAVAELLGRLREHEAGRHFWAGLGRFQRVAWERVVEGRRAREGVEENEEG